MTSLKPNFRLEMLQVARVAPKVLGPEATDLVAKFLWSQLTPEGGFADRQGRPDIYYTVFGLEGLLALRQEIPREQVSTFLHGFGTGEKLDFVHLCSLARCHASLGADSLNEEQRAELAGRLTEWRSADGGFHPGKGRDTGSAYGALLAVGAYADLGMEVPDWEGLLFSLMPLQLADGSFANEPGLPQGTTTATAAAVTLARHMGVTDLEESETWLRKQMHPSGGFLATPRAPLPDLLSTATALHALSGLEANLDDIKEPCLDFVDTLWTAEGGFHGHWADDDLDAEYTSYGLLALGHLGL